MNLRTCVNVIKIISQALKRRDFAKIPKVFFRSLVFGKRKMF